MGAPIAKKSLRAELLAALAALLHVPVGKVVARSVGGGEAEPDLVLSAAGHTFAVQWIASPTPGPVAAGAEEAARMAKSIARRAIPPVVVVVVPFLSEAGRRACEAARVSWFDLSGNAHIVAPGLRIIVDGRPHRFRALGRPASLFAPKSARVARWLLMHPNEAFSQREIARSTAMTEGFVSRIAAGLRRDNYVVRESSGALRARDPALLLDAWREAYRFDKHRILQGHVAARSGDALARFVGDTLAEGSVEHAATGLAAAWQMTHFAAFRIATFFLAEPPSPGLREKLGFREDARGANLWLVTPNDAGVFQGSETRDGLRCVHPVQAYVDLQAHPERATEAAEQLRRELLRFGQDG
jgi:hypothetical protein